MLINLQNEKRCRLVPLPPYLCRNTIRQRLLPACVLVTFGLYIILMVSAHFQAVVFFVKCLSLVHVSHFFFAVCFVIERQFSKFNCFIFVMSGPVQDDCMILFFFSHFEGHIMDIHTTSLQYYQVRNVTRIRR